MEVSLIYIKEINELESCTDNCIKSYKDYFVLGKNYNFYIDENRIELEINNKDIFSVVDKTDRFFFHKWEIDEHFMTLDEWREKRINKILDNVRFI